MNDNNQKKELARCIAYAEKQFLISQSYANYIQASLISGAYKSRNIANLDGVQHTDEQKARNELATMHRHIHRMQEITDTIDDLKEQLDKCNV